MEGIPLSAHDPGTWARLRELGLRQLVNEYERLLIVAALRESDGNQRRAAEALRILPSTLCERLKRLGVRRTTTYTIEPVPGP